MQQHANVVNCFSFFSSMWDYHSLSESPALPSPPAPPFFYLLPYFSLWCRFRDRVGDGSWGMGSELACGRAVVGVKYDLAALLCLSRQSGIGERGGGEPETASRLIPPTPPQLFGWLRHQISSSRQSLFDIKDDRHPPLRSPCGSNLVYWKIRSWMAFCFVVT